MIITVTDVKNFLSGINTDDLDTSITALIGQNQKKAEKYVGYAFESASVEEVIKLENTDILKLNNLPINSITSIKDLDNNVIVQRHKKIWSFNIIKSIKPKNKS